MSVPINIPKLGVSMTEGTLIEFSYGGQGAKVMLQ